MSRYDKSLIIPSELNKRRLSTTIIPTIPLDESDIFIVTTSIERLDLLANRFYGDASQWWIIAAANSLRTGSVYVPSNTRLRIPQNIQSIQEQIELFNGSR